MDSVYEMSTTSLPLSTNSQVGTQGMYVHVKAIDNSERKKNTATALQFSVASVETPLVYTAANR